MPSAHQPALALTQPGTCRASAAGPPAGGGPRCAGAASPAAVPTAITPVSIRKAIPLTNSESLIMPSAHQPALLLIHPGTAGAGAAWTPGAE